MSQLDIASNRLYDPDSMGVKNLKLFTGSDRDATAEKFADQLNKSLSQIMSGDFEEISLDEDM